MISFPIRHWGFFGGLRDADIADTLGVDARTGCPDEVQIKTRFRKWTRKIP
jgi:hypothetical protein